MPFSEVVLKHTLLYRVDEVFLIQRESGLLIEQASHPDVIMQDRDTVSAILTTGLQRLQGGRGAGGLTWRGAGPAWFAISGVAFALAVLSLNHGLLAGEIITVIPIIAATPVFTMLLSISVFRRERITARTFVALALVVPSVVVIVISR